VRGESEVVSVVGVARAGTTVDMGLLLGPAQELPLSKRGSTFFRERAFPAAFECAGPGGSARPTKSLTVGGPLTVGECYGMLFVLAENGDDADFDDAVLQFAWSTRKRKG
jgi:hypothetical protein